MSTTNFKLGRFSFSFITFLDVLVIPATVVEKLLGYNNGALLKAMSSWSDRKLLKVVNSASASELASDKTSGYIVALEEHLKKINTLTTKAYDQTFGKGDIFLTPTGLRQILQMSNSNGAKLFRTEVYKNEKFRTLIGLPLPKKNVKQSEFDFKSKSPREKNALQDIVYTLESLKNMGVLNANEVKQYGKRVVDMLGMELAMERGVQNYLQEKSRAVAAPIGIGQNIVSTPQGNVNIFTGENHPAFIGYLTARGIGSPFGLKADLVKKYLKAFVMSHSTDLPNNLAKKWVSENNNQFPQVDSHGFIVFKHPTLDAIAVWTGMEGNTFNWKNFWSPKIVEQVNKMIETDKGLKPTTEGNGADLTGALAKSLQQPPSKATVEGKKANKPS